MVKDAAATLAASRKRCGQASGLRPSTAEKIKQSEFKDEVGTIELTGHGFPLPNEMGEAPMNIVFSSPRRSKDRRPHDRIDERGILVTRLWYIREVDPYEKILTGMTRDGMFLVENGKVRYGLRNFRFNESLIHMLSNVEQMRTPVRASGEESFDMVVPAMKVRDLTSRKSPSSNIPSLSHWHSAFINLAGSGFLHRNPSAFLEPAVG